jgi:hypothetical protein
VVQWRVVRRWTYEGHGVAGFGLEAGHAYALEHLSTGELRQISIEVAAGGPGISSVRFDTALDAYLAVEDPPERVILDQRGDVLRVDRSG